MALKGTATIELTNVKTGEVEVVKHDNLVTNAVNDILGLNPDGYLYQASYSLPSNMLPLCPNLFGGILLYENPLEEDPAKYYAPDDNPLVGYSSNNVNAGTDIMRGSMNQTESGALADGSGYRFVFDFATSQANGSIAALGLTSKWGGLSGYGSKHLYDQACILLAQYSTSFSDSAMSKARYWTTIAALDVENDIAYSVYVSAANTLNVTRLRAHLKKMGLLDGIAARTRNLIDHTTLSTSVFASTAGSNVQYVTFLGDGEGNIWGFEHSGNVSGNSSGSATVNWIKISMADLSFTEGTWSLSAQLTRFGYQLSASTYTTNCGYTEYCYAIIKDGYLYCPNYSYKGIYKINLSNPSDIILMRHPDGAVTALGSGDSYKNCSLFNVLGNIIYFTNGYILGDEIFSASNYYIDGSYRPDVSYPRGLKGGMGPALKHGPFLLKYERYYYSTTQYNVYRYVYLMTPYLATINNLASPVEKTADKTMKITYILREE